MARVDLNTLNRMTLSGDEDCGVGLDCLDCWRGGKPFAYYELTPVDDRHRPYRGDEEVTQVDSIAGLVLAAVAHRASVHSDVQA
jgi:hypothetical protein